LGVGAAGEGAGSARESRHRVRPGDVAPVASGGCSRRHRDAGVGHDDRRDDRPLGGEPDRRSRLGTARDADRSRRLGGLRDLRPPRSRGTACRFGLIAHCQFLPL